MFLNNPDNPENFPFPLGDLHPHLIYGSVGPQSLHLKRYVELSIDSAAFAQYTVECTITLQWARAATFFSPKCPFPLGDRTPI